MKIETVPVETKDEPYASLYRSFTSHGLSVPVPLQLVSASAPLFDVYRQLLAYYFTHDGLSPLLMSSIRYTVACRSRFNACMQMNRDILALHGVTDLSPLEQEAPLPALNDRDAAIYHFAVDSLFYPERISTERIARLNSDTASDALLFDAAFHGALLLMMGPLVKSLG